MVDISTTGSYSGDCKLINNITTSAGSGTALTIDGSIDLNGFVLRDTTTGTPAGTGVLLNTHGSRVYDSKGTGKIAGFYQGIKTQSSACSSVGVNVSACRYFGIALYPGADNAKILGGSVGDIGGYPAEAYAIGVQVASAANVLIDGTTIKNMYRQATASASMVGEGLPVNFSSIATSATMQNCFCYNTSARNGTIGVFTGVYGGHTVKNNTFTNFEIGVMSYASAGKPESLVDGNVIWLKEGLTGSVGIQGGHASCDRNAIIGYDIPTYSDPGYPSLTLSNQTILSFPRTTTVIVSGASAGPPPSGGQVVVTHRQTATDTTTTTNHTFNNINFGAAEASKQALIQVNSYSGTLQFPSNVIVAGVTASPVVSAGSPDNAIKISYHLASIPSVVSGSVEVKYGTATAFCVIDVHTVVSGSVASTTSDNSLSSHAFNASITCPVSGAVVAGAAIYSLTSATTTWTGVTEDFETTGGRSDFVCAGGVTTSAGSANVNVTFNGATGDAGALIAVAFNPL